MKISKPCYFWTDLTLPEDDQKMVGVCVPCHQKLQEQNPSLKKSWYWAGHERGYGDYDLDCHFCNDSIHKGADE